MCAIHPRKLGVAPLLLLLLCYQVSGQVDTKTHYNLLSIHPFPDETRIVEDAPLSVSQERVFRIQALAVSDDGQPLEHPPAILLEVPWYIYQHARAGGIVVFVLLGIWGIFFLRSSNFKQKKSEPAVRSTEASNPREMVGAPAKRIKEVQERMEERNQQWLSQFHQIVDQRLSDPTFYLPDLIEAMGTSRTLFYRKVKKLTGLSPSQYIRERRMSRAKELLESGELTSIKEVACAVGIQRPKYFSKRFKKHFGVIPSSYVLRDH
ncbi:MAG: helix-turn-helix transcriptional regulator [Bacteroidota bacterium]